MIITFVGTFEGTTKLGIFTSEWLVFKAYPETPRGMERPAWLKSTAASSIDAATQAVGAEIARLFSAPNCKKRLRITIEEVTP